MTIPIPHTAKPSFQSGYARSASESSVPGLWSGLVYGSSPAVSGPTGSTLYDLVGKNDGTLTNMDGTDFVVGEKGYALDYDGSNDFVSIPGDLQIGFPATLSCWFTVDQVDVHRYVMTTQKASAGYAGLSVIVAPSGFIWALVGEGVGGSGSGNRRNRVSSTAVSVGTIHHCVGVFRSVTDIDVYIDGRLANGALDGANTSLGYDSGDAAIGDSSNLSAFDGQISDALIHNRILTPNEITTLYQLGPGGIFQKRSQFVPLEIAAEEVTTSTAIFQIPWSAKPSFQSGYAKSASESAHSGLWSGLVYGSSPAVSGPTGSTLYDLSPFGNHGSLEGDTDWQVGTNGYENNFDGTGDYIDLGGAAVTDIPLTLSIWLTPKTLTGNNFSTAIAIGDKGSVGDVWRIFQRGTGATSANKWTIQQFDGSSAGDVTSTLSWVAGEPTHIVAVFHSNSFREMYIDGKFEGDNSTVVTALNTIDYTQIGRLDWGGGPIQYFNGQISDTLIHNRALTSNEIATLHQLGPGGIFQRRSQFVPLEIAAEEVTTSTAIFQIPWSAKPSFQSGYAKNGDESSVPGLWKDLIYASSPVLGPTGNTTLFDVSGNQRNAGVGPSLNFPDYVVDEKGYSLQYSSSGDGLIADGVGSAIATTHTMSQWVWKDSTDASKVSAGIFNWAGGGTGIIMFYSSSSSFQYGVNNTSFTANTSEYPGINQWVFVTGTYDGTTVKVYINGEEKGTNSVSRTSNSTEPLCIGYDADATGGGGTGNFWDGKIGDTLIHNRLLTDNEISLLYQLGPGGIFQRRSQFVPYTIEGTTPPVTSNPWFFRHLIMNRGRF